MAEITDTFSEPFFGSAGSPGLSSQFGANVVGVAGRPYLIDSTNGRYNRRSLAVVQQRNTSDQRDILLLPQDIWRQSVESWHYGAGQDNQDRNESFPYRFKDSFGVDPWTRYEMTLLPATEQLGGASATYTGNVWLTLHESELIVVNDDSLYFYDTLSASAVAVSTVVPDAGNEIIDIADDGHVITTLHANGDIWKTVAGVGSTLHKNLPGSVSIEWEKDYLILCQNNQLKDATDSSSPHLIYTHPDTAYRWVSFASGRSAIYALGGIGDRWNVHRMTIQEDGSDFQTAIVAATLPDGEIGYSIDEYLGFIFIGTNKGVRMASQESDGSLTLGPIIPTTQPVRCFEGQDRFVWYGISEMDPKFTAIDNEVIPAGPVCGLGRLDLQTFTVTALTPAYANDLFTANESNKNVQSVLTYQGKRVFSVTGGGVYFESDNKVPSGWLEQGKMSFSVEDNKAALYQQAKWIPGCAGRLFLDIAFDANAYGRYARLQITSSNNRSDNLSLQGTQFSLLDLRFVMNRCPINNTIAPRITRWEFRSSPIKGKASRWEVPIMNYEELEINGVKYTRDVTSELDFLMNLVESGTVFTYQESGRQYQVHARDFVWQPESLSLSGKGWQGTYTLVIEEVQ
jgi:hypothetical protein